MKKAVLMLALTILLCAGAVQAQDKGIGVGIILGEPTGISAKKWIGSHSAIDGAIAWAFGQGGSFHLHVDYLHHNFDLLNVESGRLPLHFGIGVRFRTDPETTFGARFPVGITYILEKAPLDIFLEIGPVLDLIPGMSFEFTGSIGARFYF